MSKYEVKVHIEYDKGFLVRYKASLYVLKDGRTMNKYTKLDLPYYTKWGMKRSLLFRLSRTLKKASGEVMFNSITFEGDPIEVREAIRGL